MSVGGKGVSCGGGAGARGGVGGNGTEGGHTGVGEVGFVAAGGVGDVFGGVLHSGYYFLLGYSFWSCSLLELIK